MKYSFVDLIRQIGDLDSKVLKRKPKIVRYFSLFLLYIDLAFPKTLILGTTFIYRYRAELSSPKEALKQSNKQDLIIIIVSILVMSIVFVPKEFLFPIVIFPIGFYRLLDIWCQRMRSVFVDPLFHKKRGHLVDPTRSFIWAVINYAELIFIFAIFYKHFSCGGKH